MTAPGDPTETTATPMSDDAASAPEASAATNEASGDGSDVRRQLDEQREKYLRLAAEYDNFRKRSARERQEAHWRGQADMVRGMLEALDDLGRFAHVDPASVDARTVVEGAAMVEKKLFKTLSGHGLEVVNPHDQPFDPSVHEAVGTAPAASKEEDHLVAQVYQAGYVFNGQLLRPARVVVKQFNG
jgi:molecular chaperone GrpE